MTTFAYLGHETVGAYVAKQLSAASLNAVDDVRSADVVITYFTHASALEDAYFEEEGIVKNARKGTMLIDLSPSTLSVSREISAVATVNDFQPVEAPLAILDATLADAFSASLPRRAASSSNLPSITSGSKMEMILLNNIIKIV